MSTKLETRLSQELREIAEQRIAEIGKGAMGAPLDHAIYIQNVGVCQGISWLIASLDELEKRLLETR